jgi:site-specific recombinase XerD
LGIKKEIVMALERVFECPRTLKKLRGGPLGGLMVGFCDGLLECGFSRSTMRKHLVNVSHLNAYLTTQKWVEGQSLSAQHVSEFLRDYPSQARNRGPLDKHMAGVKSSVNRLVDYLRTSGRFEALAETAIYQPLLKAYLKWLEEHQHVAPGTIKLRAHSVGQFLRWLGPQATPQGCSELTPETVERFFLTYANSRGRAVQRSMQAALRTFFRFCLQQGYIQQPLDRAVPTLRCYKLSTVAHGLSDEQALKLLQCIDRRSHAGRRDYAICQLLYTYGVRAGQVRALRLEDIDWAGDRILFRALKHGKDTWLPLTRAVGESLLDYLQNTRPYSQDPHLFMTLRAPYRALQCNSLLSTRIAYHLQVANIEIACQGTHVFRHGFATRMLAQGHSLKAIADVLGHRHLGSTFIYTKVDFNNLIQVALPWPGEASP